MELALLAAVGGTVGLIVMSIVRLLSYAPHRLQSELHTLEIAVGDRITKIDLQAIGTEDPAKIEDTIKAIRAARELEHA